MVKNLLDHGTVFNAKDKSCADDLLNAEISDAIVVRDKTESLDETFEDED